MMPGKEASALLITIVVILLLGIVLLAQAKISNPAGDRQRICHLYETSKLPVKENNVESAFLCRIKCPITKSYCPEEVLIWNSLVSRARQIYGEVNKDIERDLVLVMKQTHNLYSAMLEGNAYQVAVYSHVRIRSQYFYVDMGSVYRILEKFLENNDINILKSAFIDMVGS